MENGDKGNFKADIPEEAVAEALRSVEGHSTTAEPVEIDLDQEAKSDASESSSDSRVSELEEQLALKDQQLAENKERMLRLAADLDNLRKRLGREKEDAIRYGNERLLRDFLPVIDNLERAVEAGAAEGLLEGVQLVLKSFVDTLGKHEVKSFSAKGQAFDPNLHEALMQQESAEVPPNTVLGELVKGYHLRDRLIRPAAVVVSKLPEGQSEASAPGASSAASQADTVEETEAERTEPLTSADASSTENQDS